MQQSLEPYLGGTGAVIVQVLLALAVILLLLAVIVWLIRFFMGARLGLSFSRNKPPRLSLVDALPIDSRRRLVLVRRDHFEHLLLIGGETDIVVEQTIFRGLPLNARVRPEQLRGVAPPPVDTVPTPAPQPRHEQPPVPAAARSTGRAPAQGLQPPPFLRRGEPVPRPERRQEAPPLMEPPRPEQAPRPDPSLAGPGVPVRSVDPAMRATDARFRGTETAAPRPPRFESTPSPAFPAAPISTRATPLARRAVEDALGEPMRPPPGERDEALPASAPVPSGEGEPPPTDEAAKPASPPDENKTEEQNSTAAQMSSLEQEMARLLGEITGKR